VPTEKNKGGQKDAAKLKKEEQKKKKRKTQRVRVEKRRTKGERRVWPAGEKHSHGQ